LLARLASNEKLLVQVCALLALHGESQRRVTPAGEWLLDNFYLIEEEIRTAKLHCRLASAAEAAAPCAMARRRGCRASTTSHYRP